MDSFFKMYKLAQNMSSKKFCLKNFLVCVSILSLSKHFKFKKRFFFAMLNAFKLLVAIQAAIQILCSDF